MIHELLKLTRPLIVVDTETTGTDVKNDRIIELGFQLWTAEGLQKEWRSLINPGMLIPASATAVHHITNEDFLKCQKCGVRLDVHPIGNAGEDVAPDACLDPHEPPTFKMLATNVAGGFSNCDYAGKNVRFDLRILAHEMKRASVAWSYLGAKVLDAERLEQLAIPRSLSHLHEKYTGRKHDGAHGALSDVRASTTVLVHQLQVHAQLPKTLDELHKLQWPDEWLDMDGSFRMINGVPTVMFGKHRGKPMRDVDGSYWDWILKENFAADIKQLARDAKLGNFPA